MCRNQILPPQNQELPLPPKKAEDKPPSGFGAYPLPPPPQSKPQQAPSPGAFQQSEEVSGESIPVVEESEIVKETETAEVAVENVSEEPAESVIVEQSETSVIETDSSEDAAEEQDANHKCWVCLENLPPKGWQACPQCGSRYHLNDSQCGISSLKNCRTCSGPIENFVKVE